MKGISTLLLGCLFLGACDKKNEIEGKREEILSLVSSVPTTTKRSISSLISPAPQRVTSFSEYDHAKISPNYALPDRFLKDTRFHLVSSSSNQNILINPIVEDGIVYAVGVEGDLHAFDILKGKEVWSQFLRPKDEDILLSGGGILYSEGGLFITTSLGDVVALQAKTGKLIWRRRFEAPLRNAPSSNGTLLYVMTVQNEITALDKRTGAIVWQHHGVDELYALQGTSIPVVYEKSVLAGYSSGEFFAYSDEGQTIWSNIVSSAVRHDSYTSLPHIKAIPVISRGSIFVLSHGGRLVSYDVKTGVEKWRQDVGGIVTPLSVGTHLFVITNEGDLVSIDQETGTLEMAIPLLKTEKDKGTYFYTGMVFSKGRLLITNQMGKIFSFDIKTGILKEAYDLDTFSFTYPLVFDENILILGNNGELIKVH